ncbi:MAG TPA: iron-containing alcohol dehydrogenase family protein [Clostridia bacterium]|nr:iron-containing alcohol dehydrogenase family protein [Clostridia bacterium]
MDFKFKIGTRVIFGKNCIKNNKNELCRFGARALIVTGKRSGKSSGALDDVVSVLENENVAFEIYDEIENNPSLENVFLGAEIAKRFGADYIIGVGGGSPLDASKAIAVLAVNDIEPLELYKNVFKNKPLPIIAVPTTAGTGSEVTPYSILTRNDIKTKMSFGNEDTFPVIAFMDAAYTETMPYEVTVNTAVDALSHAVEGYLSRRSTPMSDVFALGSIQAFSGCLQNLLNNSFDWNSREKLLYAAMLGGMTISHTGTTIVHGLGYSLTYFKNIPHGKANGLLLGEYLKYIYDNAKEKIDRVINELKLGSVDEFGRLMDRLVKTDISLSEEEISQYASLGMKQKSASYNVRSVTEQDLAGILRRSVKR